ncbi:MAG TPA: hypothetical protein VIA18_28225 [Polyangia bacterium]|nr:hypothetical protein [Polyangia bacterium]
MSNILLEHYQPKQWRVWGVTVDGDTTTHDLVGEVYQQGDGLYQPYSSYSHGIGVYDNRACGAPADTLADAVRRLVHLPPLDGRDVDAIDAQPAIEIEAESESPSEDDAKEE